MANSYHTNGACRSASYAATRSFASREIIDRQLDHHFQLFRSYDIETGMMNSETPAESPLGRHCRLTEALLSMECDYDLIGKCEEFPPQYQSESVTRMPQDLIDGTDETFTSLLVENLPCPSNLTTPTDIDPAAYDTIGDTDWDNARFYDRTAATSPSAGSPSPVPNTPNTDGFFSASDPISSKMRTTPSLDPFLRDGNVCLPTMPHLDSDGDEQRALATQNNVTHHQGGSIHTSQLRGLSMSVSKFQNNTATDCLWLSDGEDIRPDEQQRVSQQDYHMSVVDEDDCFSCDYDDGDTPKDTTSDTESSGEQSTTKRPLDNGRNVDDLVVTQRRAGLSYYEIKRRFGLSQAVSTLRGRHRNATMPRKDHPRKQLWIRKDYRLLREAVAHFKPDDEGRYKIPWKTISAWMKEQGASYKFAPASISKVWSRMEKAGQS